MSNIAMAGGATGSGTVTLLAPSTSTNRTINLPDSNGTILTTATAGVPVNGPAFSAYQSSSQSVSNATFTKIQFQTEQFDTSSAFDNATNYRFTPLVAGYYQVTLSIQTANIINILGALYFNGSSIATSVGVPITAVTNPTIVITKLVYMNGSTDYIEGYVYQNSGASVNSTAGLQNTYFQAAMVRNAT